MLVSKFARWDFQDNATRASPPGPAFALKVPLRNLLTSMCDFVSCDQIVQRAYHFIRWIDDLWELLDAWLRRSTNYPNYVQTWNVHHDASWMSPARSWRLDSIPTQHWKLSGRFSELLTSGDNLSFSMVSAFLLLWNYLFLTKQLYEPNRTDEHTASFYSKDLLVLHLRKCTISISRFSYKPRFELSN